MKKSIVMALAMCISLSAAAGTAEEQLTTERKAWLGGMAVVGLKAVEFYEKLSVSILAQKVMATPQGAKNWARAVRLGGLSGLRIVMGAQLIAAGYTGIQVGQILNDLDEKYYGGTITRNNIVAESVAYGLEYTRVFESYDYVANGNLSSDVIADAEKAANALQQMYLEYTATTK